MTRSTHPTRRLKPALQLTTLLLALGAARAEETPPGESLRQGLYAEEVKRDPDAAAKHYAEIIAAEDRRRATVATAIFRLAEVKRGQGKKDEAIALYQKLLREYPGAEAEGKLAREHLEKLGGQIPGTVEVKESPEQQMVKRIKYLIATSPDQIQSEEVTREAVVSGNLEAVKLLLDAGATRWGNGMVEAAQQGNLAVINAILEKGASADCARALIASIEFNRVEIAKALIARAKASLGDMGEPLALAVKNGRSEIVRTLLDAGARTDWQPPMCGIPDHPNLKITYWKGPALMTAIGDEAMTQMLLDAGADVKQAAADTGFTPLHLVGHHEESFGCALAEKLLARGAEVNAMSKKHSVSSDDCFGTDGGCTPLDEVYGGLPETASMLIKHGAKATLGGILRHLRPLQIPASGETMERVRRTLELKLSTGIDPNSRTEDGRSLLETALRNDALWAAEVLLKAGADPNAPVALSDEVFANKVPRPLFKQVVDDMVDNVLDPEGFAKVKLLLEHGARAGGDLSVLETVGRQDTTGKVTRLLLTQEPLRMALAGSDKMDMIEYWQPAALEALLDGFVIPHLAKSGGVALLDTHMGRRMDQTPSDRIPFGGNLALLLYCCRDQVLSANSNSKRESLSWPRLILARVLPDGKIIRQPVDVRFKGDLPELKAGDVILVSQEGEMTDKDGPMGKALEQEFRQHLQWRLTTTITVRFGNQKRAIKLRGSLQEYDDKTHEYPWLDAKPLIRMFSEREQGLPKDFAGKLLKKGQVIVMQPAPDGTGEECWAAGPFSMADSGTDLVPVEPEGSLNLDLPQE